MNPTKSHYFLIVCMILIGSSCQSPQDSVAFSEAPPVKSAKLPQPFRFSKQIEVKPGLTFDVLSWGRGSETSGSYLILRSDSAKLQYRSSGGDLDGKIQDAWNMDMDADGNPEIFIQSKGQGDGHYLTMYIYEFNNAGTSQQLRFPDLTDATKKMYRGLDSIYITDGKLRRDFPLFKETDTSGKPTGGKKSVEYDLRNNSFSVKILEDTSKQ